MIRKIYNNVEFTEFEKHQIQEFKKTIKEHKFDIPKEWTDIEILKFAYSKRFDLKKSAEVLAKHLKWRADPNTGGLTEGGLHLLKEGIVYLAGRAHGYRPIIAINLHKCDAKKTKMEDFTDAVVYILKLAQKYCFVPYHVENWVIILECDGAGLTDFPRKFVSKITEVTTTNFQSTLEKMFIMNPSWFAKILYEGAKLLLDPDTVSKIALLRKGGYKEMLDTIPID